MNSMIFMPTKGRIHNQVTLKYLPIQLTKQIVLVSDPAEIEELKSIWQNQVKDIIEFGECNLSQKRQRCIEYAGSNNVIFMDDNFSFQTTFPGDKKEHTTKFPMKGLIDKHFSNKQKTKHFLQLFNWMDTVLSSNKYGMVGVSSRKDHLAAVNLTPYPKEMYNQRIYAFWGVNFELLRSLPNAPRFDDVILKQDFYMALRFLTNGIPTIKTYEYAFDKRGANLNGGCSTYRTKELLISEAKKLASYFPKYVKLYKKSSKNWKNMEDYIIDVRIDWQKAYEDGLRNKQNKNHGFFTK